jgi:hypothetical protein
MDESKLLKTLDSLPVPQRSVEGVRYLRALFYGDFSSGKTDLAVKTLYEIGCRRILAVTSDSAWVTWLKYPEIAECIERVDFLGYSQVQAMMVARKLGKEPYSLYDGLLFDTFSTAHTNVLGTIVDQKTFDDQKHPEAPGWTTYNIGTTGAKKTIAALRNSGLHIVYTAHLREPSEKEIQSNKLWSRANIPEQTYRALAQEVNLIGMLVKSKVGTDREIQVDMTNRVAAKNLISTLTQPKYHVNEIPSLIKEWVHANA